MVKSQSKIRIIAECAIMVALAEILSFVKILQLPFDGSITLCSMLPICIVSIKYGIGYGILSGFCFSWLQILQGGVFSYGLTPIMLICSLLLDYILAYTNIGLAGAFRKKGNLGIILGIVFACFLRFAIHFFSGVILWTNYSKFIAFGQEWVNHPYLYSLCYNGIYMLPETIMTVIAAIILLNIKATKRFILEK